MLIKTSKYGSQFLGCSGFPECKTILPMNTNGEAPQNAEPEKTDEKCEKCNGEMVLKVGPYGKYFECLECQNR